MENKVENIKFLDLVRGALSVEELEQVRIRLLGKKGKITNLMRSLGQMLLRLQLQVMQIQFINQLMQVG